MKVRVYVISFGRGSKTTKLVKGSSRRVQKLVKEFNTLGYQAVYRRATRQEVIAAQSD